MPSLSHCLRDRYSLIAVSAFAVSLSGCGSVSAQKGAGGPPPPPLVEVAKLTPTTADVLAEYSAQTYARNMVEVRGRVDGYVDKWLFRPGQIVKRGQPLYVLDLRPYQAQVQQARGAVSQSEAELTFASKQVSLLQAEANLASSEANLVKARQDYERLKPLVEQDAAARQDLDAAVANLRAAEASVRSNKANVEQTRLTTGTQIQATQGRVEAQRGALQTAALNLQYATIRAPIDGVIGDSTVPVGGLVSANSPQPLTTIVPLDTIWVRFKVSEAEHLALTRRSEGKGNQGPALRMVLADNTEFPQPGRIRNTLNQVDPKTGTLEVQAEFPNPGHRLLPGQFGRIRFVSERRENVLLVPQRAVQQNQNLQMAYVVGSANKVEARSIQTSRRVGEFLIVEKGLNSGDRVIVEGLMTVRPGAVVNPKPWVEKAASTRGKAS
jgi:membrane fusion protein, multidrug efflux system